MDLIKQVGFVNIVMYILFAIVIVAIVSAVVKSIVSKNRNDNAPEDTVYAEVVSKRVDVDPHSDPMDKDGSNRRGNFSKTEDWHYATFEIEDGARAEFYVSKSEYGKLTEGDKGQLIYKGTRYISFETAGAEEAADEETTAVNE